MRYIGVSNETSYGVCEFAWAAKTAGLPKIQTIQVCVCVCVLCYVMCHICSHSQLAWFT